MKPTYGKVSRSGLMAATSSFDCIGPIAKTVEDAQIIFGAISGNDVLDSTSLPDVPQNSAQEPSAQEPFLRTIGVPWDLINQKGIDVKVKENFNQAVKNLENLGYEIKDIKLPNCLALYYIINFAEVSTNLARFDGVRYGVHKDGQNLLGDYLKSRGTGFGKESRRRLMLGAYVLSAGYYDAYYDKANAVRRVITCELEQAFKDVDIIATPTTASPAFKLGEKMSDPLKMYLEDIFTVPANIAGIPGISVPSGMVLRDGTMLPVGIQFMAAQFEEDKLFAIGKAVEQLRTTGAPK